MNLKKGFRFYWGVFLFIVGCLAVYFVCLSVSNTEIKKSQEKFGFSNLDVARGVLNTSSSTVATFHSTSGTFVNLTGTNITWTDATGTHTTSTSLGVSGISSLNALAFTSATGSSLLVTSSTIGTLGFGSATGGDLFSMVGRFGSVNVNGTYTGSGASSTVLSVNGALMSGAFVATTGTASFPSIYPSGGGIGVNNTGIFFPATNQIGMSISGTNRFNLDSATLVMGVDVNPSITNGRQLGSLSRSWQNVIASGTIYGSGAHFGEGLTGTVTSTVRVGMSGIPGCLAIADSDRSGVTYQQCNNGSCFTSTASCE